MPTPAEIRAAFTETLTHIRDAFGRLIPIAGIHQPLTFPDLHKLSEGLFLSAWTHWEEYCRVSVAKSDIIKSLRDSEEQ